MDKIFAPFSSLGSSRTGLRPFVWCPDFCSCCQGTPLHHLALVACWTDAHRSCRTKTDREGVLQQPQSLGLSKRQQAQGRILSKKPISYHNWRCGWGWFLMTLTPGRVCRETLPETLEGRQYFCPLSCCASQHQHLWELEGNLYKASRASVLTSGTLHFGATS